MITTSKNKDMADVNTKENKKVGTPVLNEYHFAGSTEYLPMTILAASPAEAEADYLKKRIKINL